MATKHRLRVAIDFAYNGTVVAWVQTAKPEDVNIIMQWPGNPVATFLVPNEISYAATGKVERWGYEIKPGKEKLAHLQFLLWYPSAAGGIRKLIPNTKEPVDVIADYLSCLRTHTIAVITSSFGAAFLNATPVDWIFTVPEIASDDGKALLLQAAESAGIGKKHTIQLIRRMEAALVWSFLKDIKPCPLKVDDGFVILDCGKGTVDIISCKVIALNPALVVKECSTATRGLCGSNLITQKFEMLVRSRIGGRFGKMSAMSRSMMQKMFNETVLLEFKDNGEVDTYFVPLAGVSDDPAAGVEDGYLLLTREDIKSIFAPVINEIISLTGDQIKAAEKEGLHISTILCIGSDTPEYLIQRLQTEGSWSGKADHSPIAILLPPNRLTAAARGATLGIRIFSHTMKAQIYYGVGCCGTFESEKDPIENLSYCPYTGSAMCHNRIQWVIKQGEEIEENTAFTISSTRRIGAGDDMMFTGTLFGWDQSPPGYSNQPSNAIQTLCTISTDFKGAPKHAPAQRPGIPTAPHSEIKYDLVVTVLSNRILFQIVVGDVTYASGLVELNA
ncbi:hypothetical protein Q9L58_006088 [Maublancomyces gigas]|uniref:Actin-like ATPase domain-containing protein n=1 Tax=Discina gigas TaxID=1032678 RepID=A0ABR3GGA9_9PEZI